MANLELKHDIDWTHLALLALRANRIPFVWGLPGIGKTARAMEVHARLWGGYNAAPFVCVAPALSDPTDACGLLVAVKGDDGEKVIRLLPDALKPLIAAGKGTLFIDELTTATAATQAAYLKVTQERRIGDTDIPPEVRIIIAANPPEVAAGGSELVTPLANRVVHMTAKAPNPRDWAIWLSSVLTETSHQRKSASLIGGFNVAKKDRLFIFPEDESKRAGAWPSPRSWHMAADCFASALEADDAPAGLELIAGSIGDSVAKEFVTFFNNMDLPDPRDVLEGKVSWAPTSDRIDKTSVMLRSIASEAINGPVKDKAEREAFVEIVWSLADAACNKAMTDIAYGAVSQLQTWRVLKSGAPRATGKFEAIVNPKFFDLQAKLAKS